MLCGDFVWPTVFARGWTEAVHLYQLGSAIAALTALALFTSSTSMYHHGPDFCRYWRMDGGYALWTSCVCQWGLDSLTHEQVLEVWYAWPLCSGLLQGEWYGHAAKCAP